MSEPTVSPDPDFKAPSPGLPTEFGPDDKLIVSTVPGRAVYTEQQRDDGEIEASYLHVYPPNAAMDVDRTEVLVGGILVDLSASGAVVGIERVGGPVDVAALISVLREVIFRG